MLRIHNVHVMLSDRRKNIFCKISQQGLQLFEELSRVETFCEKL